MENQQMSKPFLSIQHVEKVYPNGEKAVYDFNLDVAKNEFIVIVGPSGCGKSTTLRMIAGLEDITSGDMFLENELLNYKPSNERRMAIVFQSYALYPQMNVYDNIAFPLTINKYPMPVCNKELVALGEVKKLLSTGIETIVKAVEGALNAKIKSKDRIEKIAMLFEISPEASKKLFDLYADTFKESEDDSNKDEDILAKWNSALDGEIAEKKAALEAEGIKLNDNLYEVDDDGIVKIEHRKYTSYEIKVKVYETAEKLDLIPYLDKLPKELSGGQMQRVALGRAIIKNVPVFMMDEPLSNLDAKLRLTMRSEIVKLHKQIGATTIYVTHDQIEAMTMASRIVVMSRGFIQQIGTPEEVYNNPDNIFVAKFIGSPAMNFLSAKFNRTDRVLELDGMRIALDKKFIEKHDKFYAEKKAQLEELNKDFNEQTKEKILRLLSTTGEDKDVKRNKKTEKKLIAKIKALIEKICKKNTSDVVERPFEQEVCERKLRELTEYLTESHNLTIGIRSERLKIEKLSEVNREKLPKNSFIVKPTVCELLGGEYSVHFDFCGKDLVGKFDAKEKISADDEIVISFAPEDLYIFDPVTGEVIR